MRNRATAICLDKVWSYISSWGRPRGLPLCNTESFSSGMFLFPIFYMYLHSTVSPLAACGDASYEGGCICYGTHFKQKGKRRARSSAAMKEMVSSQDFGLLSLFDGVGGARRAIELLYTPIVLFIAVEMCAMRHMVVLVARPLCHVAKDVCDVDEAMMRNWSEEHPRIRHLLAGRAFPAETFQA